MSITIGGADVDRDRFGRPMIIPPDGGKPKAHTRVTKFISCLEDKYNLQQWEKRMVAAGLAARPDLVTSAAAHAADPDVLDRVCRDAKQAARGNAAATTGTALHKFTELLDADEIMLDGIPDPHRRDLAAYIDATENLRHESIETLVVNDELKTAGTPDRLSRVGGRLFVADIKTGKLEYGLAEIEMQLALYANSLAYDVATGARSPLDVDLAEAIVIHLPAGQGRCELVTVDIAAGWESVQLAAQVREWRRRRPKARPFVAPPPNPAEVAAGWTLELEIRRAASVRELENLWAQHAASGLWSEAATELARARKGQLEGAA